MLRSAVTATLLLAAGAHAHFTVQYPDVDGTVGAFKDDDEDNSPCGGYNPDINSIKTVDFHVGGDAVATKSTHPQTTWLYRITSDALSNNNWTQIYGLVQQSGPGDFCVDAVTLPSEYVGQKAILSIVGSGIDGLLYQCAAVRFVEGTADTPSACVNGSAITASYVTDETLSSMVSSSTVGDDEDSGSDPASTTTSSPSDTSTPNAAPSLHVSSLGGMGAFLTTGIMAELHGKGRKHLRTGVEH
ncbi:hypothetical protein F5B22DRAFT_640934 [Xylaria bambusicola]|uniref:uncharacterized protein n=1 Tax=Xylaria bambusicola TaxID=326684 RepID=UPI0020080CAC|nr:uncharacterized protein F5B22DRAFT_640934 [Xylaria bambusicola]KAI0527958.1 hypothetical protein F5B22DRAFT_640934 [Xylaria bambusicola]